MYTRKRLRLLYYFNHSEAVIEKIMHSYYLHTSHSHLFLPAHLLEACIFYMQVVQCPIIISYLFLWVSYKINILTGCRVHVIVTHSLCITALYRNVPLIWCTTYISQWWLFRKSVVWWYLCGGLQRDIRNRTAGVSVMSRRTEHKKSLQMAKCQQWLN